MAKMPVMGHRAVCLHTLGDETCGIHHKTILTLAEPPVLTVLSHQADGRLANISQAFRDPGGVVMGISTSKDNNMGNTITMPATITLFFC